MQFTKPNSNRIRRFNHNANKSRWIICRRILCLFSSKTYFSCFSLSWAVPSPPLPPHHPPQGHSQRTWLIIIVKIISNQNIYPGFFFDKRGVFFFRIRMEPFRLSRGLWVDEILGYLKFRKVTDHLAHISFFYSLCLCNLIVLRNLWYFKLWH